MRRRNRPRRLMPLSTVLEIRSCLHCGAEFMPNRNWQKYCCAEHSMAAYFQRKYGNSAAAPTADAKPNIVAKIDDMPIAPTYYQDEQTEGADKRAEVLKNIPVGEEMPASKKLTNLGYGIPELDEEDKDK